MADWRQIQARIRKAKAAPDPATQLSELFQRTRDGMVAFELAKFHDKAGATADAVLWYTTAAERFRRPQWRTKAAEALARLGAPIPEAALSVPDRGEAGPESEIAAEQLIEPRDQAQQEAAASNESPAAGEPAIAKAEDQAAMQVSAASESTALARKRRRRGHRGGRGRRRGRKPATPPPQAPPVASIEPAAPTHPAAQRPAERAAPRVPPISEDLSGATIEPVRGRAGDPGLASRMSLLESQLRRLLASTPHPMEDADQAPAGPGVFLVTDSDQTTFYHAESCQTLRIGIANQLRADRRAPRGTETLRTKFAEHLEISESQVAKYLNQHCVVRWLQLDEGAGALAHFAIAVLKPALDA